LIRRPLVLGHRGVPRLEPENTLASFRRAVELGADGLELDLRLSRDGELLVIHDATLGRTSSGFGWVHLRNARLLRELDAGAWFRGHPTGDRIPLLREVLADLPDTLTLNLEIKAGIQAMSRWGDSLARIISDHGARHRVLISSFSRRVLECVRRIDPSLPLAVLDHRPERALALGAVAIHPHAPATTAELVERAHGAGLAVHPWDANQTPELERLIDLGVDGIITDEVERLRRMVNER